MYGISPWLLYHHIKTDPTFPFVNVGIKKKLLIELEKLEKWITERSRKSHSERHNLPNSNELMEVGQMEVGQ